MLLQQAGWIATDIENLTVTILALDSCHWQYNIDILKYVINSNYRTLNTTILSSTPFNITPASILA